MMTRIDMVKEINTLASGTIANLCRCCLYQAIDDYRFAWTEWVLRQHAGKQWETWQDCHTEYVTER